MFKASDLVIRRLSQNEAELFREVRLEALRNEPTAFTSSYDEEVKNGIEWFADVLNSSHIFAAFLDNRLLGIAGLYRYTAANKSHIGSLWTVYVHPEARNKGVAHLLIEIILNHAASVGLEQIKLTVSMFNRAAQAVYADYGFTQYGIDPKAVKFDGEYIDEILLVKFCK